MAAGVREVVAAAGAAGIVAAALVGAKGHMAATAMLGPRAAGAPGLELTEGGGEVRCTRGRKE